MELADLIQQIEKFRIEEDKGRELERITIQQWQEAQKLEVKFDMRELGRFAIWLWMGRRSRSYILSERH